MPIRHRWASTVSRARRARRRRQIRKITRNTQRLWAVDTAIGTGQMGCWALVDPGLRLARMGTVTLVRKPQVDSTRAEAQGLLKAIAFVPTGATIATDVLMVAQSLKGRGSHHQKRGLIGGLIGEIALRCEERGVRVTWAKRSDAGIRRAPRSGTSKAEGAQPMTIYSPRDRKAKGTKARTVGEIDAGSERSRSRS